MTTDEDYNSDSWKAWTDLAIADTIPGAVSFLKYAESKGVEIFYVSNRKVREQEATIQNLQKFGFPMADDAHFHLRSDERSKERRRTTISETHTILLLMGDNLGDFAEIFDGGSTDDRALAVDEMRHEFGDRFIVLPNAMYGTWEGTLYQSYDLTPAQKDSIRKAALKIY